MKAAVPKPPLSSGRVQPPGTEQPVCCWDLRFFFKFRVVLPEEKCWGRVGTDAWPLGLGACPTRFYELAPAFLKLTGAQKVGLEEGEYKRSSLQGAELMFGSLEDRRVVWAGDRSHSRVSLSTRSVGVRPVNDLCLVEWGGEPHPGERRQHAIGKGQRLSPLSPTPWSSLVLEGGLVFPSSPAQAKGCTRVWGRLTCVSFPGAR